MFHLLFLVAFAHAADYSHLVRSNTACVGPEQEWNCVKKMSLDEFHKLGSTERYGFVAGENRGNRALTDLFDRGYNYTSSIPQFATNYLVLNFPSDLQPVVEWYKTNRNTENVHEIVPGNYLNDKNAKLRKLDLDEHQIIRNTIQKTVKPILAWWVDEKEEDLVFTSLFGVREYTQESMMLMHADRHNTHHISAVVHLYQEDMSDGWPLQVQVGETVSEVFCSKPCLILYVSIFFIEINKKTNFTVFFKPDRKEQKGSMVALDD